VPSGTKRTDDESKVAHITNYNIYVGLSVLLFWNFIKPVLAKLSFSFIVKLTSIYFSLITRNIVPYLKKYGKNPVTGEVCN